MADQACSLCGKPTNIRFLYDMNGRIFCQACIPRAVEESQARGESTSYIPLIQKSICPSCHNYIGESAAAVQVGNFRVCAACADKVRDWDYPLWLKASLAGLLVLLGFALLHGRKYFDAGRELYRGERLVAQKRYGEALPHLQATLRVAPESDKAALLAAKAALLSGNPESAREALRGHNGGRFEDANDEQFQEVKEIWARATAALDRADRAVKLARQGGKEEEAAKLMHEAATYYPEMPGLSVAAEQLDEGVAFAHGDYASYLAIAEKQWKKYPGEPTASALASALACKYAVTGDASYRQKAEEMMAKANEMAQGDARALKDLEEFEPRFRQRLDSRKIITRQEYDRRFRKNQAVKK